MSDFGIGYRQMFQPGRMTIGTVFAIEAYSGDVPTMKNQVELAKRAEELGFSALWFRDVPLRDPSFGDVGQVYDPWTYLGYITAHTRTISLATGAIIFPLRHPIDLAKAAASIDQLSGGRLVLGIAAGDRPIEYPAYGRSYEDREMLFQESVRDFRRLCEDFPRYESVFGVMGGGDLIPKPFSGKIPLFVTGHSGQSLEWIAENADGWLMYPRDPSFQKRVVDGWKSALETAGSRFKPFSQSLYIDLTDDPDRLPQSIHLGYRLGRNYLLKHLKTLQDIGVNHVFLNLKYGKRPADEVLEEVGKFITPHFPSLK